MINHETKKYSGLHTLLFKNDIIFVLCLLTATANALHAEEAAAPLGEQSAEQESAQKVEDAAEINTESGSGGKQADAAGDEQASEAYNIYRKEHPENPCERDLDTYDYEKSWYDDTQVYINSRFCEPALWFDNFFSSDRLFDEGVAGTYIRWRNDISYDEEEKFSFKTRIKASVELPGLEHRLRLTFEGDDDEDLSDIAPGNGEETSSSLGAQFDFIRNARSKFNISVNLRPRIRLRYRYTYPIYETITLRLTQEVQNESGVNSARTIFDFEKVLDEYLLFRASTEGKISEEFDGVDWLQAFVLYHRINKKASLSYETSVKYITEPVTKDIDYRVAVRFRKNFHRRWLFYEVIPEMTWPITYDDTRTFIEQDRRSKWKIVFRLDIHFGNAYKKHYQDYN